MVDYDQPYEKDQYLPIHQPQHMPGVELSAGEQEPGASQSHQLSRPGYKQEVCEQGGRDC
jgi:hypothetical protein